ncbi:uncharacterized protein B0H64DRAFT_387770 [Chaetomium fimeti]|uniref:Uncharacterized protein n=1 Tax=Chaetomium fimeti TaxID=1854472 RepID=A0AAE0LVM7_9PEZI|nr:hypothetical protein B0H64DRAFT_387770 [Chaetomium fimeti]
MDAPMPISWVYFAFGFKLLSILLLELSLMTTLQFKSAARLRTLSLVPEKHSQWGAWAPSAFCISTRLANVLRLFSTKQQFDRKMAVCHIRGNIRSYGLIHYRLYRRRRTRASH